MAMKIVDHFSLLDIVRFPGVYPFFHVLLTVAVVSTVDHFSYLEL